VYRVEIPLFDGIGIKYGPEEGFPSYHQVAIQYTAIGNPVKAERLHPDFHNYNMKKIIDVVLIYKDGRKEPKTLPTAECKSILEQIKNR
jgi:hypothetical protein